MLTTIQLVDIIKQVEEVDPAGPRAYHGTAVLGYCIYVIGGFDGMDYFNSCRCFDAVTKTWREVRILVLYTQVISEELHQIMNKKLACR